MQPGLLSPERRQRNRTATACDYSNVPATKLNLNRSFLASRHRQKRASKAPKRDSCTAANYASPNRVTGEQLHSI